MPLHTSINISGWALKDNPHGYTTKGSIHHNFELVADDAIAQGAITATPIRGLVRPARRLNDPFVDTLAYLEKENPLVEEVYRLDKSGKMTASSPEAQKFIEARMAEGSTMLRDLIYTAWVDSAALTPTRRDPETNILNLKAAP